MGLVSMTLKPPAIPDDATKDMRFLVEYAIPANASPFSPDYYPKHDTTFTTQLIATQRNPVDLSGFRKQLTRLRKKAPTDSASTRLTMEHLTTLGGYLAVGEWAACVRGFTIALRHLQHYGDTPEKRGSWAEFFAQFLEITQRLLKKEQPGYHVKGAFISLEQATRRSCLAQSGNVKLPFVAYSELPVVTCPGAGGVFLRTKAQHVGFAVPTEKNREGCASFCYSFSAMRNPTAWRRWALNTLHYTVAPERHVEMVCNEVVKSKQKIFRLFVDGDFRHVQAIKHWMDAIRKILLPHDIYVYGYTKSFPEFLKADELYNQNNDFWPKNYVVNLSSGNRHKPEVMQEMRERLSVTKGGPVRGAFIAVDDLQRLLWKVFGQKEGERRYRAYLHDVENFEFQSDQMKNRLKKELDAITAEIMNMPNEEQRANTQQYVELFLKAVNLIKAVKKPIADYNKLAVTKRLPTIAPGQLLQAINSKLLQKIRQENEVSCPIDCGRCPFPAFPQHDKLVDALLKQEHTEVANYLQKGTPGITGNIKTTIHMCGNRNMTHDIIIGKH